MVTDSLIFPCPACGIKLSVPLAIAGISGPCPACWEEIHSPRADGPAEPAVELLPVVQPAPAGEAEPAGTVLPDAGKLEVSAGVAGGARGGMMEPAGGLVVGDMDAAADPGLSRPMPRPLPKRTVREEIVIEPETGIGSMWNALPDPLPAPSRKLLQWLLFLLAALCLSGGAVLAYFALR